MTLLKSPHEIRESAPDQFKTLVVLKPLCAEDACINHRVEILLTELKKSAQGFYEPPSVAKAALQQLLGMTDAQRRQMASAAIQEAMKQQPHETLPIFRLMARDQGSGREFLMEVGYLDDMHRKAAEQNAMEKDYWVTNQAGSEVDAAGKPVDTGELALPAATPFQRLTRAAASAAAVMPKGPERDELLKTIQHLKVPILGWTSVQHGERCYSWGVEEPEDPAYKWKPFYDDLRRGDAPPAPPSETPVLASFTAERLRA
jgi:hypothetical protein